MALVGPAGAESAIGVSIRSVYRAVHPRLYGVCEMPLATMVLLVGTSPVVRGLRDALWRRWCSWWVHPRSCGVCEMPLATMVLLVGTSPVVRGLRDALWRRWCSWWVHPRSCGVCEMPLATMVLLVGTPPVVRGLRDAVGYDGAPGGYTPGRAGSARCRWLRWCSWWVHPRSCGVCVPGYAAEGTLPSSSPPMRGLPILYILETAIAMRPRHWAGRLQSNAAYRFPLILSLSKDAHTSHKWQVHHGPGGPFFSVHAGQACGRLHPPHCSQRIFGFHRAASWVSRTLSQKERGLYPKMKRPCQWRMGMTE